MVVGIGIVVIVFFAGLAITFAGVDIGRKLRFCWNCRRARCRMVNVRVESNAMGDGTQTLLRIELLEPTEWAGRRLTATYRPASFDKTYSRGGPAVKKLFQEGQEYDCWVDRQGEKAAMLRSPSFWTGAIIGLMGIGGLVLAVLVATGMISITLG